MGLKIEAFDVPRASRDAAHHATPRITRTDTVEL
jgi:hypothetical protein